MRNRSIVNKRLLFMLALGFSIALILIIRLGYVQFSLGGWLAEEAEESWSRDIPFEAERGEIRDRNDEVLATNISAPTLLIVPRQVQNPVETAAELAPILQMDKAEVYEKLTEAQSIVRINPQGRKMEEATADEIRGLDAPGLYIAEDNKRHYPNGRYLSHVLGFAGVDNQGLTGIERYYDEHLKGDAGYVSFYSDAKGQRMPGMADRYIEPQDGSHVRLTIDDRVQTIIERELDRAEATYDPDGAMALAMDPNTGEILGMSSRPDFHPEDYQDVPPEIYNQNRPVWSQYEPGSTFKIITLAAALEENLVDLDHDTFYDPGHVEVAGQRLRCWKKGGHGQQTFLEVVQNSCNPGFVALGERLGKTALFDYIRSFGFGEKTGIDLDGEGQGILFDEDAIGPLEQATTAFGQGVSVTPIQQVAAVAAAVNGGDLYQPYLAKEWLDPEKETVVRRSTPDAKKSVISEETSKEVRRALEHVVAKGTGKGAFADGYRVGGKTGTAQKSKDGVYLKNNHIVSFIGVAPMDDPEIVVYIAVDNPKDTLQFGGVVAAPIAGTIINDSLQAMGVEKREDQLEKDLDWNETPLVEVPDVTGMELRDLHVANYPLKLETEGDGTVVTAQAPAPGEKVANDSVLRLYLGDKSTEDD
ncbi:stage V sporulation protein D (sporulation-specific penicillin-binding protein) [Salsuginibacillus halophilus]|uniref:serine-type D-Ala-D-Ala carboxypeptidase n=1 Tax=Salsuginibacillus halophilus TaxID=517424 RepID=A0A2P8HX87_9BACI|nr:stage V sporulation protein D [Salsuginibacillus halophilus]PSL50775.1 stage V sporulation protein D (sporulation-specific penicillin-binding protein) [Salsuginibacillus halophilus]